MPGDTEVHCSALSTTFVGIQHSLSTPECPIRQFRGIKYASIPARFRRSQLHTVYTKVTDAREHGPIAPQLKQSRFEESLWGFTLEVPPLVQDEFECLNLNITSPSNIPGNVALPVMVWVHGGGNVQGRGSSVICDAGKLVRTSVESGRPVIVVAINYRLGIFGFGASEALEEANHFYGEEGVGNYGLYDQLNAIAWVRKFISAFGGDPSNITLFGESAGAINIHSILMSKINQMRPVASRAIIQSGTIRPAAVLSVATQGSLLSRIMSRLEIKTVEELRNAPMEEILSHTPNGVNATDDGVFFKDDWREHPIPEGISGLIIGDCMFESALWQAPVSLWSTSSIIRRVRAVIRGIYKADAFLRTYGITPCTDDEDAQDSALNIINDVHFAWPTHGVAQNTKTNGIEVFRYVFDQESPWNSVAHHAVDLLYLFDNVPPVLPSRKASVHDRTDADYDSDSEDDYFQLSDFAYNASRVRKAIQDRWIAFANGEQPWSPEKFYVFGPEGEIGERGMEELNRRRRTEEWGEALDAIPPEVVHKVAVELGNGPRVAPKARF